MSTRHLPRISGIRRRDDTILRLGGDGDNWHMTWMENGDQLAALCDGMGWPECPMEVYNSRLIRVSGDPEHATFRGVEGFPRKTLYRIRETGGYYGFGVVAVGERIIQLLATIGGTVKLIFSPDGGRTWCNQDGSSPVVWEPWTEQSNETMLFHDEPGQAFVLPSILQMGRGYGLNRDGYLYIYSPNGLVEGSMNQLVMCRVPVDRFQSRDAYEFYAGEDADGTATWSSDIHDRVPVLTFPSGWVNRTGGHGYAWHPSLAYNEPLDCYMMLNWGMGCDDDLEWFAKPGYLGLWTSPTPWGPWTQVHEETAWTPGGDALARCYQPQFAPGWIAEDGRSFWMVWTDFQNLAEPFKVGGRAHDAPTHDEFLALWIQSRRYQPFYAFNAQRVDILVD